MMAAESDDKRAHRTLSTRLSGTSYRGWMLKLCVTSVKSEFEYFFWF